MQALILCESWDRSQWHLALEVRGSRGEKLPSSLRASMTEGVTFQSPRLNQTEVWAVWPPQRIVNISGARSLGIWKSAQQGFLDRRKRRFPIRSANSAMTCGMQQAAGNSGWTLGKVGHFQRSSSNCKRVNVLALGPPKGLSRFRERESSRRSEPSPLVRPLVNNDALQRATVRPRNRPHGATSFHIMDLRVAPAESEKRQAHGVNTCACNC